MLSAEAERGTGTAEGGDHEVGFVAWEGVGTLAVDDHVGNAVVRVVVERESSRFPKVSFLGSSPL